MRDSPPEALLAAEAAVILGSEDIAVMPVTRRRLSATRPSAVAVAPDHIDGG